MEHGTLPPSYPDVESQKDHKGTLDVNQRDANDTQIGVKKVIAAQYVSIMINLSKRVNNTNQLILGMVFTSQSLSFLFRSFS